MNATTSLPEITSVEQARGVLTSVFQELQQARWRVAQLEKELYGPSSERQAQESNLSIRTGFAFLVPPAD